jgi:hypothetical protein
VLDVFVAHDAFVDWLVATAIRRFGVQRGRMKSQRSMSIEAGLDEKRVFILLSGTGKASEKDVQALAPYLGVSVDEFRRRAGVVPITSGTLTDDERISYAAALRLILERLE